jgi:RimJ/RimL family protein N-acetyltransferase
MQLSTARLILREFTKADAVAVHAYAADPVATELQIWGPNAVDDTREFLERTLAESQAAPRVSYQLAVTLAASGELIGGCGLFFDDADGTDAEIGYTLHPAHWRHGYATEAARALLAYGFDTLGKHRIAATCDARNTASFKVMERLGMRREGPLREHMWTKGRWRDTLVYAILEHEYRAR